MSTIFFDQKCWSCSKKFVGGEFVNIVKLDDGTIHYVHGGKCSEVPIGKDRLPMKDGDWWIRRMGMIQSYLEVDPAYTAMLRREIGE